MKKRKLVSLSLIASLIVPYTIPFSSSFASEISSSESVEIASNSVENTNTVENDSQSDLQIADRRRRGRGYRNYGTNDGGRRGFRRQRGDVGDFRRGDRDGRRHHRHKDDADDFKRGDRDGRRVRRRHRDDFDDFKRGDRARRRHRRRHRDGLRDHRHHHRNVRRRIRRDHRRDHRNDYYWDRYYGNRRHRRHRYRRFITNPRYRYDWGWHGGRRWYPDYDYWGGGFWGNFVAGIVTLGLTQAVVDSNRSYDNDREYVVIKENSPGYRLFESYGLTQVRCDTSQDLVFIYGPQDSLICAVPNNLVEPGYYDVDQQGLRLILRN